MKFEQKLTKLAKVRHLPSGKLSFRIRSLPSLDSPRFQDVDFKQKTAIAFPQRSTLLPLLTSVQSLFSLPSLNWRALWLRLRRAVAFWALFSLRLPPRGFCPFLVPPFRPSTRRALRLRLRHTPIY
jgi:hypothetical protein